MLSTLLHQKVSVASVTLCSGTHGPGYHQELGVITEFLTVYSARLCPG